MISWTPALVAAPGEARDEADVLAELFRAVGPSLRGGSHGPHLRALGAYLATADLGAWESRLLDFAGKVSLAELKEKGTWWGGEIDRANWRVTTESGKIELLPAPIAEALSRLTKPEARAGFDHFLLACASRDEALSGFDRRVADPGVTLHPSSGFAEGDRVRVVTEAGSVEAVVHLDEGLRADVVDLPAGYGTDAMRLIPADRRDCFVGTPMLAGLPCRVERA
jgi:anaerobic selenocysteine-containing dehydrogenase